MLDCGSDDDDEALDVSSRVAGEVVDRVVMEFTGDEEAGARTGIGLTAREVDDKGAELLERSRVVVGELTDDTVDKSCLCGLRRAFTSRMTSNTRFYMIPWSEIKKYKNSKNRSKNHVRCVLIRRNKGTKHTHTYIHRYIYIYIHIDLYKNTYT